MSIPALRAQHSVLSKPTGGWKEWLCPLPGFLLEFSASRPFQREGFLSRTCNELTVNALPLHTNNNGDKAIEPSGDNPGK